MIRKTKKQPKANDFIKEYTYRFRIYPNAEQIAFFKEQIGHNRFVYNFFLERSEHLHKDYGVKYSYSDMQRVIPLLKKGFPFLKDVNSQSLQGALLNLDNAYKRFFNHESDHPVFKSKKKLNAISIPQNFKFIDDKLYIPKVKSPIKVKFHRKVNETVKSISISVTSTGKYYVNMSVEKVFIPKDKTNIVSGIDLGIKTLATVITGISKTDNETFKIENPKYYIDSQKQIIKLSRQLSKKKHPRYKGDRTPKSKNYVKLSKRLALLYERQTNQIIDYAHKKSFAIINDSQVIVAEDLNIKGMLKNKRLSKAIQNAAWSRFLRQIEYKADFYGRDFRKVGRFYPSSKSCSTPNCGYIYKDLKLSERFWICPECNTLHDRDENASYNLFLQGLGRLSSEPINITIGQVSPEFTPAEIAIADDPMIPVTEHTLKSNLSMKQEVYAL